MLERLKRQVDVDHLVSGWFVTNASAKAFEQRLNLMKMIRLDRMLGRVFIVSPQGSKRRES
jgi:hypothetical protein